MYRDSRASITALATRLDAEIATSEAELVDRRAEVSSTLLQVFPLFDGLGEILEPLDRPTRAVVVALLVPMSVVALPLALLWRPGRRDLRAVRGARRKLRRLEARREEAADMLAQMDDDQRRVAISRDGDGDRPIL